MNTENTNAHLAALGTEAVQVQGPSKRALADVLWEAANEWLRPDMDVDFHLEKWSCWAVCRAGSLPKFGPHRPEPHPIWTFFDSLGVDYGCTNLIARSPRERQQSIRYMWLLLAMHVAEDEGLTV
jgi:hypothetical protein